MRCLGGERDRECSLGSGSGSHSQGDFYIPLSIIMPELGSVQWDRAFGVADGPHRGARPLGSRHSETVLEADAPLLSSLDYDVYAHLGPLPSPGRMWAMPVMGGGVPRDPDTGNEPRIPPRPSMNSSHHPHTRCLSLCGCWDHEEPGRASSPLLS